RRGLGIAAGEPRYVVALRGANTVVLGRREELASAGCVLRDVSWIAGCGPAGVEQPDEGVLVEVQIRHRQAPVEARVAQLPVGALRLELAEPVSGVAPGQSAVLYRADQVLGGGIIREAWSASAVAGGAAAAARYPPAPESGEASVARPRRARARSA
ncbi:MAG: aminomethyltransferase beta-barrel domain-containing protein, partial [Gemmatimonadota bacterium]